MAVKHVIGDAYLLPGSSTDLRNVGRSVRSGCYPYTKIFVVTDSL